MSLLSGETLKPPAARQGSIPTPASSASSNLQPKLALPSDRQRSSSFSDNLAFKSAQRVFGLTAPDTASSGGLSANSSFRRRSSGGNVPLSASTSLRTNASSIGLGRRDSQFLKAASTITSPSTSGNVPTLKTLDSYNARNVAAALDQGIDQGRMIDDVWQSVCVRVLPLFNGEGIRGFVEDLNELVLMHVQRTFARATSTNRTRYHSTKNPSLDLSSLVTGLLIADLTDLIRIGCSTLSTKLSPPTTTTTTTNTNTTTSGSLSDRKLIERLNEIWLFFYTGILPQLEAVFWVLRCDDRLRAAVGGTGMERNQERGKGRGEGRIDVRRIALIEFRDGILHPEMDRIVQVLDKLYSSATSNESQIPPKSTMPSKRDNDEEEQTTDPNTIPLVVAPPDIRRSRSQPRPSTESTVSNSTLLSPPLPSTKTPSIPVATTNPPLHLPTTPIRQFSSPARLPSPDPSPSNSPSATRRNSFAQPTASSNANSKGTRKSEGLEWADQTRQSLTRRLQMILVLKSLLTWDDRQEEMEQLSRIVKQGRVGGGTGRTEERDKRRRRRRSRQQQHRERREEDEDQDQDQYEDEQEEDFDKVEPGTTTAAIDSPRILFDEPADLSDVSPQPQPIELLPYGRRPEPELDPTRSRSNSRSRVPSAGRRSISTPLTLSRRNSGTASGYASPIVSTSPTEFGPSALDLNGLGYALGRVREEAAAFEGSILESTDSSDGITPTASVVHTPAESQQQGQAPQQVDNQKPNRRRSLFLANRIGLGRSNSGTSSNISQDTLNLGGGTTTGEDGTLEVAARGEKLRRNLLRRNSSRNSTHLLHPTSHHLQHETMTVLGGKGLSMEDD
ncbi:HbrB domain-containing protein [Sporobolomyces koalae]|uniref:HbrB domain-containing protein n=1 Tax=Sporobolomyces koalae TaxID=500713 RepID=UPI0031712190